jgi:hypothetical protein
VLWGGVLIAAGILFLLQNLGVIQFADVIWSAVFGLVGVFVLSFFFADRNNWWALIPGITLLDLGLLILLNTFIPNFEDTLGGALFLGGIGLSFWLIYLLRRDFWWAIIPGGALFTLAGVVVVATLGFEMESGGVFFLGLGLTFALLALVPTPEGRLGWAWIPGGILLVMGLLLIGAAANLMVFIWPAALILVGLFLIYRTLRSRSS